jgi:serine/threonine-protein kinase ATR
MKQFVVWVGMMIAAVSCLAADAPKDKPLMKDFMGMCVHTVQFKPELYKPVCRLVRDYHGLEWDLGDETNFWPVFPFARNRVDWGTMYGQWVQSGYEISASIMFGATPYEKWKNPARDAETSGFAFARFFGPQGRNLMRLVDIGNEPGHYTDPQYRLIFEAMARGIRAGDSQMKIATCAAIAGDSHKYAKSLSCVKGLESLYDVINVHSYAEVKGWPTWERSFPEESSIVYLKDIQAVIDWRNRNAVGKEVWLTEFGWDASTKPAPAEGTFKDWKGSTETEQARYLVRSWLVFSAMDLDRAYMFWFNDDDKPQVHGAAGLTRNYQPKPSFWAVAHLYAMLGEYRFSRKVMETSDAYVYEYTRGQTAQGQASKIYAAWIPCGTDKTAEITFPIGQEKISGAQRMPLTEGKAEAIEVKIAEGKAAVPVSGAPIYISVQ